MEPYTPYEYQPYPKRRNGHEYLRKGATVALAVSAVLLVMLGLALVGVFVFAVVVVSSFGSNK
jgi:hypothetical protein